MLKKSFLLLILILATPQTQAATDCAAVTDIPSTECEALVALYNNTGGDSWSNNSGWLETNAPCSWYGVSCYGFGHVIDLNLSHNQLSGTIPPELGQLSNWALFSLDLSDNQLSGPIPPELGQLSNLFSLDLSDNQLSGPIPPELGQLSYLTSLSLYDNQLSGTIPPELGNLSSLEHLGLSSNQLSGTIPPVLGQLRGLQFLDLSDNQLSGTIPPELGQLSSLLFDLDLSDNQLSGTIPPELGQLSGLMYSLNLSSNQLSGTIPPELGQLSVLQVLNLSDNQLSGTIPPELGQLSGFAFRFLSLYLDSNQLCGKIPVELKNLSYIPLPNQYGEYLSLQNNNLINYDTAYDADFITWLSQKNPDWRTQISPSYCSLLQFSAADYNVNEGDSSATLTVTRSGASSQGAVSVNYATTDDTATAGSDYTQTTGTLSWADGDSADKTITITIIDDGDSEGNETFTITLTDPISGENLDNASVTITDDDTTLVTLNEFTATALENEIILEWQTATEFDNAGFHLWRATGEGWKYGDYSTVIRLTEQLIAAQGDFSVYSYIDTDVETGATYYYGLEDIDLNGQSTFHWNLIDSATAR